jgi:hypothetical protein
MSTIETAEQLVREPLGTSRLKEELEVAVPQVARRKRYTGNRRTPREDGRLGCSGRTTIRRRQCNGLPG